MTVQRPLVAVLAVATLGALAAPATASVIKPPPSLRVVATEYKFALGKTIVRRARAPSCSSTTARSDTTSCCAASTPPAARSARRCTLPRVAAGKQAKRTFTLVVGRYSMVCTISDHAALGMTARLTVRKPR